MRATNTMCSLLTTTLHSNCNFKVSNTVLSLCFKQRFHKSYLLVEGKYNQCRTLLYPSCGSDVLSPSIPPSIMKRERCKKLSMQQISELVRDLRTFETLEVIAIREIRETKPSKRQQKLKKYFFNSKTVEN